ncbi:PREDICTED: PH domain-containing protein DDB_G0275795-like, partial [Cyprinodon variegatus]|uniref:PH domain-containing protein DDB_G0275795-like n=1 Tax=Cyprinodon variegatus TaxID=28743 RepID=UPI000742CAA7
IGEETAASAQKRDQQQNDQEQRDQQQNDQEQRDQQQNDQEQSDQQQAKRVQELPALNGAPREQCGGTMLRVPQSWRRALVNYSPHQPGGSGVEPQQSDQEQSDQQQSDQQQSDQEQSDQQQSDQPKNEQQQNDQKQSDQEQSDQQQSDQPKNEQQQNDQKQSDQEQSDQEQSDQQKNEQQQNDQEQNDQEKSDQEKSDQEQNDQEQSDQEQSDQQKNEQQQNDQEQSDRVQEPPETDLQSLLEDVGLEQFYREKLSLSQILEINEKTTTDDPGKLGECSMSKSDILNQLLSNSQMNHDTFAHRNMECGDTPRRISNGLTEITWYLPCGNKNMDIFSEPVTIANLRGDIASFETQFSFLCQTSAAVFVFFDELKQLEQQLKLLTNKNHKEKIYLVGNQKSKSFTPDRLKKIANKLRLNKSRIIIKTKKINDADFVKCLKNTVSKVLTNTKHRMSVEKMADIAHQLGIEVDEDSPECQDGRKKADAITAEIKDTSKYKEEQFPLQDQIWNELTLLEKEEFRLRKVGSENIEDYKSKLRMKKEELRQKQNSYAM